MSFLDRFKDVFFSISVPINWTGYKNKEYLCEDCLKHREHKSKDDLVDLARTPKRRVQTQDIHWED